MRGSVLELESAYGSMSSVVLFRAGGRGGGITSYEQSLTEFDSCTCCRCQPQSNVQVHYHVNVYYDL